MVGQVIIDRLHLEPFITALTIMLFSAPGLPFTDDLIHNLKIDTCMHCAKYIPKLQARYEASVKTIHKDIEIFKRLDKELPFHVCGLVMGYSSSKMNWFHYSKQSIFHSILYSIRLKTATPKDLVKYHKQRHCSQPDPKQVEICKQFIAERCKKTDRINKGWTSYGLKHAVEQWTEVKYNRSWGHYIYVSNGAFIRAALDLGYRCEYAYGIGPTVYLNISLRGKE